MTSYYLSKVLRIETSHYPARFSICVWRQRAGTEDYHVQDQRRITVETRCPPAAIANRQGIMPVDRRRDQAGRTARCHRSGLNQYARCRQNRLGVPSVHAQSIAA